VRIFRRLALHLLDSKCAANKARDSQPYAELQMKRITVLACALGFAAAPYAFADPVKMNEAQLDQVVAGQLVDVSVSNVANPSITVNPNVNPNITANPSVSVSVL
jgi:hypothetical protein